MRTKLTLFWSASFLLLVYLDLFSKYKIHQGGGFYICNQGFVWGLKIPGVDYWLTVAIICLAYLILTKSFFGFKHTASTRLGLLLILSGGLANLINRIYAGCIVDFLKISLFNFPLFNLADIYISTGCLFFIIHILNTRKRV